MSLAIHRSAARAAVAAVLFLAASLPALGGPGAHGPNGEHLDTPAAPGVAALPRVQAHSEDFELLAELRPGELSIFVDRYDTNVPVLGATLVVERGEARANATFRPEQGDYVITDAAFVQALAAAGEHPLVFTLTAGKEADLLDGTLVIAAGAHDGHDHHAHWHLSDYLVAGGGLALAAAGGLLWWRRRRASTRLSMAVAGGGR